MRFVVIGVESKEHPGSGLPDALARLGAVELMSGVWVAGLDRPVAVLSEELVRLAPDQKIAIFETVSGEWASVLSCAAVGTASRVTRREPIKR